MKRINVAFDVLHERHRNLEQAAGGRPPAHTRSHVPRNNTDDSPPPEWRRPRCPHDRPTRYSNAPGEGKRAKARDRASDRVDSQQAQTQKPKMPPPKPDSKFPYKQTFVNRP